MALHKHPIARQVSYCTGDQICQRILSSPKVSTFYTFSLLILVCIETIIPEAAGIIVIYRPLTG